MKKTQLLLSLLVLLSFRCGAQQLPAGLSFSGYVDVYAAFYTDSLPSGDFQKFPTYAPRSGQIGLNIAQLIAAYKTEKIRANITLHYGDIAQSAWSPDFRTVQEANAGIRITKKLWADLGFFRTHIGAEGLYPKENIASSIALPTYFEPYYEAGLKLTYQVTDKFEARLYLLNGYNMFVDNNRRKSIGMLATYAFNDSNSIVYANYIGDDSPDSSSVPHTRFYNNLCVYFSKGRWRATLGFDFATQMNVTGSVSQGMSSGLFAVRYRFAPKWNVYARGEFFSDEFGIVSGTYNDMNIYPRTLEAASGETLGLEYKPTGQSYIRLEGRALQAGKNMRIFYWNGGFTDQRYEAILSMGVWF